MTLPTEDKISLQAFPSADGAISEKGELTALAAPEISRHHTFAIYSNGLLTTFLTK